MNAPIRARLSPALRAALGLASPNLSAALRALLLIGLHTSGYELEATLERELRLLIASGELDSRLETALAGIVQAERRTGVGQVSYTPPIEAPASDADDPFAGIGIEV